MMRTTCFLLIALSGCSSEQEICADKFAKLDSIRKETTATIIRQTAECQAVSVEFSGNRSVVDPCIETLRALNEMAVKTNRDVNKRMEEPDMIRCAEIARR